MLSVRTRRVVVSGRTFVDKKINDRDNVYFNRDVFEDHTSNFTGVARIEIPIPEIVDVWDVVDNDGGVLGL